MASRYIFLLGLCLPTLAFASAAPIVKEQDVYFGEAYFYAYQHKYIDAISRQDIALGRFYGSGKTVPYPLNIQFGDSKKTVGELEFLYRMPQRTERAIKLVLDSNADELVHNEALFRLARFYLQRGEPQAAMQSMEQISGKIPDSIREDDLFLRAQIYMANGKFSEAAMKLRELKNSDSYKGFAAYNLGVALIKSGQDKQGFDQLNEAGEISGNDEVTLSIRDKANLALGYRLIDTQQPALAKQYLDRVRLNGRFSNKALLGSGWIDAVQGKFDKALAPWSILVKRNVADTAVQESLLGVPYAYTQLNLMGKATLWYGKALEGFGGELTRLEASIKSVREGKFFQALLHAELLQDQRWPDGSWPDGNWPDGNWIDKLKSLPDSPETYYLLELMASKDFQGVYRNYLDLRELSKNVGTWDEKLKAFSSLRQGAASKNQGFDDQLSLLKTRVQASKQKIADLMSSHQSVLETMAGNELNRRHRLLLGYHAQARFGLAESYERAKKMQAPSKEAK